MSHIGQHEVVRLSLEQVRVSGSPRTKGEDELHVQALAEAVGPLPPIVVHRQTMTIIDGVHRFRAAQRTSADAIDAVFFDGDMREAYVLAVCMNSAHGLPLSLADRKVAARRILCDFPEWSNRRVAEVVGLSDKTIGVVRRRVGAENPHLTGERVGRDGVVYPSEAGVASRLALEFLDANPGASARDVASATGASLSTAKKARRDMRVGDAVGDRASGSAVAVGGGRAAAPWAPTGKLPGEKLNDPGAMVRRLRADPSVRFSEHGRRLLRMLDVAPVESATWDSIANSLPIHCVPSVVELARRYSESWRQFANEVSQRADIRQDATDHRSARRVSDRSQLDEQVSDRGRN
ncbi:ParB/RepB/Spo0J family partition protein [Nocardia sp. NBC_01499]|uniref:ParB N-terminal domain-containing protein n=1 Tax=Nocardia sp. NBC_01499 TaxID=2903597 RepID=UPI00386474DB